MKSRHILYIACMLSCIAVCACENDSSNQLMTCQNGQRYNSETGKCETGQDTECQNQDDCKDGKICSEGHCVEKTPAPECNDNSECGSGECVDGKCKPQSDLCQTSEDCTGNLVCQNNACVPECSTSDDCKDGLVCKNHACVPECSTSNDCTAPEICKNGVCTKECESDSQCEGSLVCRKNTCQPECETENDCEGTQICKDAKCIIECTKDENCDGGLVCKSNRCKVECENTEDCDTGYVCAAQKCILPCQNDSECAEKYICQDKICVPDPLWCMFDTDCATGLFCSNNQCKDPNIECNKDSECEGTKICQNNQCKPQCTLDTDCEGSQICRKNVCRIECIDNSECAAPKYCKASQCTTSCSVTEDCPSPYSCIDGTCKVECQNMSDCKNNKLCSNMKCVECISDNDCTGTDVVCVMNACQMSNSVRYPCLFNSEGGFEIYKNSTEYKEITNDDGSLNLCKLGYHPSVKEIEADSSLDKCIPLYSPREYDFYGDGIDSNCDGYDYDLSKTIFVTLKTQGLGGGNDNNSGNFNKETNQIEGVLTLNGAFNHLNVMISTKSGNKIYFPDILVASDVESQISETIKIPIIGETLNDIINLKTISNTSEKTIYTEHVALIRNLPDDLIKTSSDYAFYNEGNHPKEKVRIYGGFTRDPLNKNNYLHWQHLSDDVTNQEWNIEKIEDDSYVLLRMESESTPMSLWMSDFNLTMKSEDKSLPRGTTFVGLSCGNSGCLSLNLNHTNWNIIAPQGQNQTDTLPAGDDGNAGLNGVRDANNDAGYVSDVWCPKAQMCDGHLEGGTGGCGGHALKLNDSDGDNKSNYDTSNGGYKGLDGEEGMSVKTTNDVVVASGGEGGQGLSNAGIEYDGCDDSDSVDASKGRGADGQNGMDGVNGSHANLWVKLAPSEDHSTLYFESNYDSNTKLSGSDGAQGGGGGGGAVYQVFSAMMSKTGWISAGSGGNGGCGGKGGKAGGTGGSAIGFVLNVPKDDNAYIDLKDTKFSISAGNGGKGQDGSDGGIGGKGGLEKGYGSENSFGVDTHCDKATAGGNGGNGGGGGAGAGGLAGKAVAIVLACNRNVTSDCSTATNEMPCFVENSRTTYSNCGYIFPTAFIMSSNSDDFGTVSPGTSYADSTDSSTGKGAKASNKTTEGQASIITTWIGNL